MKRFKPFWRCVNKKGQLRQATLFLVAEAKLWRWEVYQMEDPVADKWNRWYFVFRFLGLGFTFWWDYVPYEDLEDEMRAALKDGNSKAARRLAKQMEICFPKIKPYDENPT